MARGGDEIIRIAKALLIEFWNAERVGLQRRDGLAKHGYEALLPGSGE